MPAAAPKPDTSKCPRCGAGLRCGMLAGEASCWCAQLPPVMPLPSAPAAPLPPGSPAPACFCPACLQELTDERKNALSPSAD